MRFSWFTVAAIAAVLGLPSICLGDETPKRKPGYWEFVTLASGLGTVTAQACIGEDDDIAVPETRAIAASRRVPRRAKR